MTTDTKGFLASRVTSDLSKVTQDQLDHAAYSLKTRLGQTLGDMTPSQKLAQVLQRPPELAAVTCESRGVWNRP